MKSALDTFVVPNIRPHEGFPQFAVVGDSKVEQFMDDDVVL